MSKKTVAAVFLLALVVTFTAGSCQKIDTSRVLFTSPQPLKLLDPIPLEYGELVAAFPHLGNSYWVELWFQKPDKTVSVVLVNVSQGKVFPRATIPRK